MAYGYAAQNVDPETTAKAAGREIPVKPKFAVNVCKAIKGKTIKQARTFLEGVVEKKIAVPFKTHKRHVKHQKGGIGPGAYPVNTAAAMLKILNEAASNAEYKGLDPDTMYIWHTCAHRGAPQPGYMPRAQGRATPWFKSTSHIEIVIKNAEATGEEKQKKEA